MFTALIIAFGTALAFKPKHKLPPCQFARECGTGDPIPIASANCNLDPKDGVCEYANVGLDEPCEEPKNGCAEETTK